MPNEAESTTRDLRADEKPLLNNNSPKLATLPHPSQISIPLAIQTRTPPKDSKYLIHPPQSFHPPTPISKMPILKNFTLPASAKLLEIPEPPHSKLFLAFISGNDPITNQPWCTDVRAALPHIDAAFNLPDAPSLAYVSVGQRQE